MAVIRSLRPIPARAWRWAACALAVLPLAAPCLGKQSSAHVVYPVKPIRIIVASPPSAADDFFARVLAEELETFYRKLGRYWKDSLSRWTTTPNLVFPIHYHAAVIGFCAGDEELARGAIALSKASSCLALTSLRVDSGSTNPGLGSPEAG